MKELQAPRGQVCRYWQGQGPHVLVYLHGIQSHSEWLIPSATELAKRDVSVYAPDRRGSGRSPTPRGDVDSCRTWLQDGEELLTFVRHREEGKTIHLAGLCWGARLALPLSQRCSAWLSSLILISPGLYLLADYPPAIKLSLFLSWWLSPQKTFRLPLQDAWFTRNPAYLKFIYEDTLGLREVSARFLRESLRLNVAARHAFFKTSLPLFVLLAGKDKIVDVPKTTQAFSRIAGPKKRLKMYPGWSHSLEFEPDNQLFFEDLLGWFDTVSSHEN